MPATRGQKDAEKPKDAEFEELKVFLEKKFNEMKDDTSKIRNDLKEFKTLVFKEINTLKDSQEEFKGQSST